MLSFFFWELWNLQKFGKNNMVKYLQLMILSENLKYILINPLNDLSFKSEQDVRNFRSLGFAVSKTEVDCFLTVLH